MPSTLPDGRGEGVASTRCLVPECKGDAGIVPYRNDELRSLQLSQRRWVGLGAGDQPLGVAEVDLLLHFARQFERLEEFLQFGAVIVAGEEQAIGEFADKR